jgi:SAM-dependent methyltransferase
MKIEMSEKTTGIYKLLSAPFIYELVQNIFWKKGKKEEFITGAVKVKSGLRILDIGCGTGALYKVISESGYAVHYVGLDLNSSYIEYASNLYPQAQFFCSDVAKLSDIIQEKFDAIIILNVLHHLDDVCVDSLFHDCKKYLNRGGRLISLDPLVVEQAVFIEKMMIKLDRGQHIRNAQEYYALASNSFDRVMQEKKTGFLKVPMTVNIMECEINE